MRFVNPGWQVQQLLRISDHLADCNFCRERSIPNSVLSLKIADLQKNSNAI